MRVKDWISMGKRRALWLSLAAVGLLNACGGGTGLVEPFAPTRLLAFGDQISTIQADGRKFTINTVDATGALMCDSSPIWVQHLATVFGLTFSQCNPTAKTVNAQMLARAGAKAADIKTQIDSVLTGPVSKKDLATMMAGTNDVLEQYALFNGSNEATLIAELRARGTAFGAQINRLALAGPRVVVVTSPDLGLSPYGIAQKAAFTGTDRAALLTRLGAAFNGSMRLEIINDGRLIGLVFGDEDVQTQVKFPLSFGLSNVTQRACQPGIDTPNCTSQTLVTGANTLGWLWADDLMLSPAGQQRMGLLAEIRARSNPF